MTTERRVVVCRYLTREHAEELATRLRRRGIATAVVPSDECSGVWDVLVPSRDVERVDALVRRLLVRD